MVRYAVDLLVYLLAEVATGHWFLTTLLCTNLTSQISVLYISCSIYIQYTKKLYDICNQYTYMLIY